MGVRCVHSYSIHWVTHSFPHKIVHAMVNGVEQLNLFCKSGVTKATTLVMMQWCLNSWSYL
jgi:hypothetical protein